MSTGYEDAMRPGTLVVGVDGSDSAEHALDWAADQADLEGLDLSVAHVVRLDHTGSETHPPVHGAEVVLRRAKERVARTHPEVDVQTVLLAGEAGEVLRSASSHAALVVVGSRGRGQVRSVLLGSVGATLVRGATCPVVVVRPHHPGTVRRGVAVGTDATAKTRRTLEYAYREASLRRLPLTVVHCLYETDDADEPIGLLAQDAPGLDRHRADLAECVSGLAEEFPDVNVRLCLAHGPASEILTELSSVMNLTVVGRHRSSRVDRLGLGSLATPVLEHASGVVAVVPDLATVPA